MEAEPRYDEERPPLLERLAQAQAEAAQLRQQLDAARQLISQQQQRGNDAEKDREQAMSALRAAEQAQRLAEVQTEQAQRLAAERRLLVRVERERARRWRTRAGRWKRAARRFRLGRDAALGEIYLLNEAGAKLAQEVEALKAQLTMEQRGADLLRLLLVNANRVWGRIDLDAELLAAIDAYNAATAAAKELHG